MKRLVTACLGAALLCLAGGCTRSAPPNIILIVVDTLRADRIGATGNTRGLTPFVDSLAARGYVFHNAYANSSWTNPSVASILTSRFQSQHGIVTFESVLADSEVTLPEVLKERGYATGFFSANGLISRKMGFAQGFDMYKSFLVQSGKGDRKFWVPERAARLNGEALAWLDTLPKPPARSPLFLYFQYMEPHHPYAPRPEAIAQLTDGRPPPDIERANGAAFFGHIVELDGDMLRNLQDVYDAEVLSLDLAIRDLFAQLAQRGVLDNAVVVFTSDHGEEFKEHGLIGHEKTLFEEVVRVPLIIAMPGQTERRDIEQVVSLIDVPPTLVDLAGAPSPQSFEGTSLVGTFIDDPKRWRLFSRAAAPSDGASRAAYSELIKSPDREAKRFKPHEHAVVLGSHKLIVGVNDEREYYDLTADPGEQNPNGLDAAQRTALQQAYEEIRARARDRAAPRAQQTLDPQTRERMRALGYDH